MPLPLAHALVGGTLAVCRAAVFDPMRRIESDEGPMNSMPADSQAAAKSAFSLRKP